MTEQQPKAQPSELITTVNSDKAPKAGIFSQGKIVSAGSKLFYASGQISIDPEVLKNLTAVLHAAGTDLEYVVKVNIYLDDMENFDQMNEVYCQFFTGHEKPARACVAVKTLPLKAKVEMECVAVVP